MLRSLLVVNLQKNDFFAGRHPIKIFLPNKKHYSVVSDGIRNFLAGGPVNLFLTSPPTRACPRACPRAYTRACTRACHRCPPLPFILRTHGFLPPRLWTSTGSLRPCHPGTWCLVSTPGPLLCLPWWVQYIVHDSFMPCGIVNILIIAWKLFNQCLYLIFTWKIFQTVTYDRPLSLNWLSIYTLYIIQVLVSGMLPPLTFIGLGLVSCFSCHR